MNRRFILQDTFKSIIVNLSIKSIVINKTKWHYIKSTLV